MTTQQIAKQNPIRDLIKKAEPKFKMVSSELDWVKEAFYANQIIQGNSMLQSFISKSTDSLVNSIVNVATVGLTLNPALGYAYLVPRDGKCKLDISYRGFIKILTDSGTVRNIDAEDVYENDHFIARKGSDSLLEHSPSFKNRGEYIGTYAIAFFHDGGNQWLFMNADEINACEKVSANKSEKFSPWKGDFRPEMRKKTVIRRLFKYLPKSKIKDNVISALGIDDDTNQVDFKKEKKDSISDIFQDAEVVQENEKKPEVKKEPEPKAEPLQMKAE
jgi:recombination protein RecT